MLPCPCTCGESVRHGSLINCPKFIKMNSQDRKNFCIQNNFCLRCMEKREPNHQRNCKAQGQLTCYTCRKLGHSTDHNYVTCSHFIQQQQNRNVTQQAQTVNFLHADEPDFDVQRDQEDYLNPNEEQYSENQHYSEEQDSEEQQHSEEDNHEYFDEEYDDQSDDIDDLQRQLIDDMEELSEEMNSASINFTQIETEDTDRRVAFRSKYFPNGYEESKFNLRKQLDSLKEFLIGLPSKCKGKNKEQLERDIERTINMIEVSENKIIINERDIQEMKDKIASNKKPEELLTRIKGLIEEYQLIKINKDSDNSTLYKDIVNEALKLYSVGQTFLGRIFVRVNIRDDSILNEDTHNLIRDGDIEVEIKDGKSYLLIPALLDDGATLSLLDVRLKNYLTLQFVGWKKSEVSTFEATKTIWLEEVSFNAVADNNDHHCILGNFTKKLEAKTICNQLSKELIKKELRLDKHPSVAKRIIWPKNLV